MYSNLPGALALLQEAGETQTVLDWGNAWLRDSALDSKTGDVALSMALTYCDTAAMLLEEDPDNASLAVEAMNAALKLLKAHGSNQQLEADIAGAMQVLRYLLLIPSAYANRLQVHASCGNRLSNSC